MNWNQTLSNEYEICGEFDRKTISSTYSICFSIMRIIEIIEENISISSAFYFLIVDPKSPMRKRINSICIYLFELNFYHNKINLTAIAFRLTVFDFFHLINHVFYIFFRPDFDRQFVANIL